ncbi:MAG: hypothetical protein AMJ81_11025 [Phycisphaerae bacterium SM23_33]|nr:MAG: hypothetical protein AMJ81_11025 [Phycisphaerae bacterium SM23_33]
MWHAFIILNEIVVRGMDYVLGWILYLPRDLRLFTVAVMTSAILTFVRLLATDQDWLRRADADKKRLGELTRQARRSKPLLYAVVPVALLAAWCFARLGYEPAAADRSVEVRMYVPASAIGRHAHMIPQEGLEAENGWVQEVARDRPAQINGLWDAFNAAVSGWLGRTAPPEGVAVWRLRPTRNGRRYDLKILYAGGVYEKQLLVDSRRYAPPVKTYDGEKVTAVQVAMAPVKLFGVVGGLDFIFFPPWLVAYLLIAIPFVSILKWVFSIH